MRCTLLIVLGLAVVPAPAADLVLVNGKVWTVDRKRPDAEAVAVWRDRIVAVGSNEEIRKLVRPTTRVLDLKGRRVVPGFYDSHVHMLGSGLRVNEVALKDAKDEEEFGKRLREFDRKLPRDRWLTGGEWDHDRTFKGVLPTAKLIDKYVPTRPVFLRRYDGHMGVANSAALKQAGITAETADPDGGVIVRLPGGREPSGLLRDNAQDLVEKLIPEASLDAIVEAVQAALAEARRVGVTSVQDMDGSESATRAQLFRVYQQLAKAGKLTVRVDLRWPLAEWEELAKLGVQAGHGDDWVKIGGVKGFVDGSLGSSTAKMFEPYVHEPASTGVFVTPPGKLREYILGADKAGLNVAIHAIGDKGNAEVLDAFAEAAKTNGARDRRFRIEHAQHLRPADIKRFAELGVIASMQPYHIIDDGRWAEGRIGAKRCASSYANRALLDAGAKVAFGSDWSVAPLNPLLGLDAAVNRRTLDSKHPKGWFPAQKITIAEAIEAYTLTAAFSWKPAQAEVSVYASIASAMVIFCAEAIEAYTLTSAWAGFQEKDRGSIEPGKLADLVILSRDILDPKEKDHIGATEVLWTIVGGKIVFEKAQ